ncbi:hypothetical protein F4604DRAFT_1932671 [Suillus subluteus]|nr:hypothetical protein F4604DRAFT_1932671 [Suillus subluteus]
MSKLSFTVPKLPAADHDRAASDKFKLSAPSSPLQCRKPCFWLPYSRVLLVLSALEDSDEQDHEPNSSNDEDDRLEDKLITSFNKFSAQRPKTKAPTSLLVIPSKPSPDWRKATQKRRAGAARFILDSAKASASADGSVGGPGTRDTLDSGPQLSEEHAYAKVEETEDQKALLLAGDMDTAPQIDSIPVPPNETDAVQQDVADLPDVVTIDDYARVRIIAFPVYSPAAQSFPALVVSIL